MRIKVIARCCCPFRLIVRKGRKGQRPKADETSYLRVPKGSVKGAGESPFFLCLYGKPKKK